MNDDPALDTAGGDGPFAPLTVKVEPVGPVFSVVVRDAGDRSAILAVSHIADVAEICARAVAEARGATYSPSAPPTFLQAERSLNPEQRPSAASATSPPADARAHSVAGFPGDDA